MKIRHGLLPGQVLQRYKGDRGGATIAGTCRASGEVECRVLKDGRVIRGHQWRVVGRAEKHTFKASIDAIRTGGPYRIELRIRRGRRVLEPCAVDNVFVGDVWFLAGQSNMEGVGNMIHAPKPHPKVRAFFMRDEWDIAKEKLHWFDEAVDSVHNGYGDGPDRPPKSLINKGRDRLIKGVSPGLVFGLEMFRRTRVPQGLVPCAHGGTSMAEWSPRLRERGGASLYGAMMRRYHKLGQPLAGVLWYQGESDANRDAAAVYTKKMIDLVAATRRDMAIPTLPWVVVQIGCHAANEDPEAWNSVQEQQRCLPERIDNLDVTTAVDLELDDGIHIGGKGQNILGHRLARLADRLVHKPKGLKPGIRLQSIEVVPTPDCNIGAECMSIELTYQNAVRGLTSEGRPAGFSLLDQSGRDTQAIYKTTIHGNRVILHTNRDRYALAALSVSYGHGRNPMCTITDDEGMSIPAMQAVPLPLDVPAFWNHWQAAFLPKRQNVAAVSCTTARTARGWRKAPLRDGMGVLPRVPKSERSGVYAMKTTLKATEALEATLTFGANAPFKMWLNGKPLLKDLTCTMPITVGQYEPRLSLKTGENELLVAFAPPTPGAHLGIVALVGAKAGGPEPRVC